MLAHQPPEIARANGIDICYEIFGDAGAEPLLLIMGLGAQMIHWDDEFCRQLAARGFRVIRFDNRDIGKSSKMAGGKRLTPLELLKLKFLKIPVAAPYRRCRHAAAARNGFIRSKRRRWSFTAPSIRWCAPRSTRTPRPPFSARNF